MYIIGNFVNCVLPIFLKIFVVSNKWIACYYRQNKFKEELVADFVMQHYVATPYIMQCTAGKNILKCN